MGKSIKCTIVEDEINETVSRKTPFSSLSWKILPTDTLWSFSFFSIFSFSLLKDKQHLFLLQNSFQLCCIIKYFTGIISLRSIFTVRNFIALKFDIILGGWKQSHWWAKSFKILFLSLNFYCFWYSSHFWSNESDGLLKFTYVVLSITFLNWNSAHIGRFLSWSVCLVFR